MSNSLKNRVLNVINNNPQSQGFELAVLLLPEIWGDLIARGMADISEDRKAEISRRAEENELGTICLSFIPDSGQLVGMFAADSSRGIEAFPFFSAQIEFYSPAVKELH